MSSLSLISNSGVSYRVMDITSLEYKACLNRHNPWASSWLAFQLDICVDSPRL